EEGAGGRTGLGRTPDNPRDRRADFAAAHRARKSTPSGFGEVPQSPYRDNAELREASPELARILGIEGDEGDEADPGGAPSPSPAGGGSRAEGARGGVAESRYGSPPPGPLRGPTSPLQGEVGAESGAGKHTIEGDRDTAVRRARRAPVALSEGSAVQETARSLERLLREGRREFLDETGAPRVWTPHRPPRPEKSEGGIRLAIKSDFQPKGDQPQPIPPPAATVP